MAACSIFKSHTQCQNSKTSEFDLDNVSGNVKIAKAITLKTFESQHISAQCHVKIIEKELTSY